jgi:hypothetical protein
MKSSWLSIVVPLSQGTFYATFRGLLIPRFSVLYHPLLTFQGHKPTNGFHTSIEHVGVRGDILVIVAQFWENEPGRAANAVTMSPYEVVKVRKDSQNSPQTKVEFYSYPQYSTPK